MIHAPSRAKNYVQTKSEIRLSQNIASRLLHPFRWAEASGFHGFPTEFLLAGIRYLITASGVVKIAKREKLDL
jgi:hypothetical protein